MKRSGPPKRNAAKLREWELRSRAQSAQNARLRASVGLQRGNGALKRSPGSGGANRAARRKRAPKRWREGREGQCARCRRRSGLHPHHVFYEQHVEDAGGDVWDPRNRLMLCEDHHLNHHGRGDVVPLDVIPDRALAFGVEVFGMAGAVAYLQRYYRATAAALAARGLAA